jgi:hypothetical protein
MEPMETTTVGFRLRNDVWARYSAEAEAQGVSLATHLRRRLEHQDDVLGELAALRRAVERATAHAAPASSAGPVVTPGIIIEILLLLRTFVGPQKAAVARKEVERRGFETWS